MKLLVGEERGEGTFVRRVGLRGSLEGLKEEVDMAEVGGW